MKNHSILKNRFVGVLYLFLSLPAFYSLNAQPIPGHPKAYGKAYDYNIPSISGSVAGAYVNDSLVYIGTTHGLYKFNGSNVIPAGLPFPSQKVNALHYFENKLWIGTDSGLYSCSNQTSILYSIFRQNFNADTISSITSIGNELFVGTSNGLFKLNNNTWQQYTTSNSSLVSNKVWKLKANNNMLGFLSGGYPFYYLGGVLDTLNFMINGSIPFSGIAFVQPYRANNFVLSTSFGTYRLNLNGSLDTLSLSFVASDIAVRDTSIYLTSFSASVPLLLHRFNGNSLTYYATDSTGWLGISNNAFFHNSLSVWPGSLRTCLLMSSANQKVYLLGRKNLLVYPNTKLGHRGPSSYYSKNLNINQVDALYHCEGDMFWDRGGSNNARYNVPKEPNSGVPAKHAMFAFSPWLGGFSDNGLLYQSAQTYRQSSVLNIGFKAGPIVNSNNPNFNEGDYYRIWKINRAEIIYFQDQWALGNVQNGSYQPSEDIIEWPGNHPDGGMLAPYVDYNSDNIYNWRDGDYPSVTGDQALWWVFNDSLIQGGGGNPVLVEIRASAFAFNRLNLFGIDTVLNYTTFLNYKVINKSGRNYDSLYLGIWADGDIGNYTDDYLGMDVVNDGFYFYNGDDEDEGIQGYGFNPPSMGIYLMRQPKVDKVDLIDNNRNGIIDEPNETCGFSRFLYFNNDGAPNGNPTTAENAYNYMTSRWRDSTHVVFGGNGYPGSLGSTNLQCNYTYPGNSDLLGWGLGGNFQSPVFSPFNWSESMPGPGIGPNAPGDRRGVGSVGPLRLLNNMTKELTLAFVFSRADSGGALTSVQKMQQLDVPRLKQIFAQFPGVKTFDLEDQSRQFLLFPNPATDKVYIKGMQELNKNLCFELTDILGRRIVKIPATEQNGLYQVDLEFFPNGIYFLRAYISSGENLGIWKIQIQR